MKKITFILLALTFAFSTCKKETPISLPTITIGNQNWISKNLDVDTYRNGDEIPQVQDANLWDKLTTGAWCYYDNNSTNGTTYGKLYNWYAVNDSRGLAPKGYHIPTDAEWTILTYYLGGESVAGTKMKSTSGWQNNGNGNNTSGFAGLPGGLRDYPSARFIDIGGYAKWWSSSEYNSLSSSGRIIFYSSEGCKKNYWLKINGFSVRCLKD